jgi:hypothetical protein
MEKAMFCQDELRRQILGVDIIMTDDALEDSPRQANYPASHVCLREKDVIYPSSPPFPEEKLGFEPPSIKASEMYLI